MENILTDLQYLLDKHQQMRELPGVEACISDADREEIERIWREQEQRGIVKAANKITEGSR